jgi:ketosteroid isomerase-like protein
MRTVAAIGLMTVDASAVGLPSDLAKAVRDHEAATRRGDIPVLADLVDDDYVLVNSDSSLQNKEQYLADFRLPGFRIESFAITEPLEKALGDTAVTGGVLHLAWMQDGESQSRLLRIAHVWVKEGGRWRLTYTQLTRVPQ